MPVTLVILPHLEGLMFHSRSADLIRDHRPLLHIVTDLIHEGAYAEADYVLAVIRTELAELGHAPAGSDWLRPGQAAPVGWTVYEAALGWCRNGGQ